MEKIIDSARNHFLNNYPDDIPIEQAYLHIGVFIGWIIANKLYSSEFEEEFETQIERFRTQETSCVIMAELWDGTLSEHLLNKEGLSFANYYYKGGHYLQDVKEHLASDLETIYEVDDSWENYHIIRKVIDQRFEDWKKALV